MHKFNAKDPHKRTHKWMPAKRIQRKSKQNETKWTKLNEQHEHKNGIKLNGYVSHCIYSIVCLFGTGRNINEYVHIVNKREKRREYEMRLLFYVPIFLCQQHAICDSHNLF